MILMLKWHILKVGANLTHHIFIYLRSEDITFHSRMEICGMSSLSAAWGSESQKGQK